jgi:hypothetical protein
MDRTSDLISAEFKNMEDSFDEVILGLSKGLAGSRKLAATVDRSIFEKGQDGKAICWLSGCLRSVVINLLAILRGRKWKSKG